MGNSLKKFGGQIEMWNSTEIIKMREGKEPEPWRKLMKAEWDFRQVEPSGFGGFQVDQGIPT